MHVCLLPTQPACMQAVSEMARAKQCHLSICATYLHLLHSIIHEHAWDADTSRDSHPCPLTPPPPSPNHLPCPAHSTATWPKLPCRTHPPFAPHISHISYALSYALTNDGPLLRPSSQGVAINKKPGRLPLTWILASPWGGTPDDTFLKICAGFLHSLYGYSSVASSMRHIPKLYTST